MSADREALSDRSAAEGQYGCCRGCGNHRDLSYALMCDRCVRDGVPVPKIGEGHGDGVSPETLLKQIGTLDAIVSGFCKAIGEPIPQDAICAAGRLRAENEALGALINGWAGEVLNGADRSRIAHAMLDQDAVRRYIEHTNAEDDENERLREAVAEARFYVERWNLAQADDDSRRWLVQNSAASDEKEAHRG
jgi:hypothetical protein